MNPAITALQGNRLALSRLLTQVENDAPEGFETLNAIFPGTGKAHLIGVTGAPGTGKSSLVNRLALAFRKPDANGLARRVAIIAVDPSSPFSGGAVLGDRVRMRDLASDSGIFIRSMASRGALGGLARTTAAVAQVFDAAGYEIILIETVGAGQSEVDIACLAHTTIVVEAPGMGDDIQVIKAGILEIADILVVNKADRPGAEATAQTLQQMCGLSRSNGHHSLLEAAESGEETISAGNGWSPPVILTVATEGNGVEELASAIRQHKDYLEASGVWAKLERGRLKTELEALVRDTLVNRWRACIPDDTYEGTLDRLVNRQISPWQAVNILLQGVSQ